MIKKPSPAYALSLCLLGCGLVASAAHAADGDWKRGRVYYQRVCTDCHTAKAGGPIAPNARSMAEWTTYLNADKHAKSKDSLKQYVSKEYRASIKATNKAAEKYADIPDEQLFNDIKSFMLKGAKDGDSPASCL
ncbi:MAG: c-type cytochrome [Betaproteobacteria bacterium]|nr:c-type cytochrome [Betaproteobacteria bacterium]MBI2224915.1 c-type cytochrome [Betaproteobacteria bacterium]MBI2293327.1 c-type cytochrome [Betaproteobacteria bacterium]